MKRIVKSVAVAALGLLGVAVASAQTSYSLAPNLTSQELSKTWSVSAALRAFYDDNYNTAPKGIADGSFGFEVSPTISANFPMEQTFVGLSAFYSLRYYSERPDHQIDHTFQLNGTLTHNFSERYKLSIDDVFVVAQEPEVIDVGAATSPLRTEGNNIRNRGSANLTTGLTPTISLVWGYANTFFDYEQEAKDITNTNNLTGAGSRSALLDRMEHLFSVNGRWQATPATVGIVGYQYGITDYSSKDLLVDPVAFAASNSALSTAQVAARTMPSIRDSRSHYGFVGADHNFTAQLQGSLRVGIQATEYIHATSGSDVSPYADGSVSWTYSPGSYVQGGVRYSRSATDVAFSAFEADPTLDTESLVVYAAINHQFTAQLTGSLLSQYQSSKFKGGDAEHVFHAEDNFFTIGLNVAYAINQFLSAEAGYNYDHLDSGLPGRSFDRNRVYIGLRARY